MNYLAFDIESGPSPWAEIEQFYVAPPAMPPWSDDMCKMGNLKDETKRAEKLAQEKARYEAELAGEKSARDAHKCEWASRAALSPLTGQVLAVGFTRPGMTVILGEDTNDEAVVLKQFWDVFRKYHASGGRLVGWNSNGFDVPFLVRRSWKHGVDVPVEVYDRNPRYLCGTFVDLMQRWAVGQSGYEKLDTAARWLGLGGKPDGVDGGHFAALWRSGDAESRLAAKGYLLNDLEMTWKLGERMGVIS